MFRHCASARGVVCNHNDLRAGSRDGAVMRTLASHQCGPGSTPGPGVICGLSLLLVLVLAPRGFSPGTPVLPSPENTNASKFQFDRGGAPNKHSVLDSVDT